MIVRNGWGGVAFWVCLLVFLSLLWTHAQWYDDIGNGDKALFWTNLMVAVGTLALAFVTVWNVRQTNKVISSEERRHQQQYAPLITLQRIQYLGQGSRYNPQVSSGANATLARNIGMGIAINVRIKLAFFHRVSKQHHVLLDGTNEAALRLDHPDGRVLAFPDGKPHFCWNEEVISKVARDEVFFSALVAGGEELFSDALGVADLIVDRLWKVEPSVVYCDRFGNEYETVYSGNFFDSYTWRQPLNLMLGNNNEVS